ncbi:MAG: hypothetical protein ACYC1Q_04700 [Bacteroidia bacterium]
MEPNLNEIRKNYERFSDDKLIRIATEEATSLRPEALALLREIIRERGLSEDIHRGIDAQFEEFDEQTLYEHAEILRKLPCPLCGSGKEKLNATITGTVISIIYATQYEKEFKIACPNCLDAANNHAMTKSVLLGWWGPWGLIKTPQALYMNDKMKKQNRLSEPNELFLGFVHERRGRIEANKNNPTELRELIKYIR